MPLGFGFGSTNTFGAQKQGFSGECIIMCTIK